MPRPSLSSAIAALVIVLLGPCSSLAADLFVVDARGVDLPAGQKLDGAASMTLAVGQRVTLVSSDGRIIKLKGPFNAAPLPDGSNAAGGAAEALQGLLLASRDDTRSAGIIRSGEQAVQTPTPWLVEIEHSGDRCLVAGEKTVLWRHDPSPQAGIVEIAPADRSWSAKAAWPQGSGTLTLPDNLVLRDGQAYTISQDGGPVSVTVHLIPAAVGSDAARAAWMVEVGCAGQAKAMLASLM
jgi:hypothetical protein